MNYSGDSQRKSIKNVKLIENVNAALHSVPVATIRKYFRKCRLFEDCYREGISEGITGAQVAEQRSQIKKRKKQHRRAPVL